MSVNNKKNDFSDYDIIIPFAYLRKAIDDCFVHIMSLVKTARHLHYNSDYSSSIFFTIISFEEFSKLCKYTEYYKNQEGVPRKEIRKLNGHDYKLKILINRYESSLLRLSDEDYKKQIQKKKLDFDIPEKSLQRLRQGTAKTKIFFTSLNQVKQFCLYYDLREGRSLTLSNQILKNNLGHLSLFLLEYVMFFINFEHVTYLYGDIAFEIPKEHNIMANDPSWKECEKFSEIIKLESFQPTISKAISSVREIMALHEELDKRNLIIK